MTFASILRETSRDILRCKTITKQTELPVYKSESFFVQLCKLFDMIILIRSRDGLCVCALFQMIDLFFNESHTMTADTQR